MRLALAALFLVLLAAAPVRAGEPPFGETELWIESAGARHHFFVEVALSDRQWSRGLMFRKHMAPDRGMLFRYDGERNVAMWMKNTFIPLDMVFVGADGRIKRIAENTTPLSLETIYSGGPVAVVIELNGGIARRLGIAPGDRVIYKNTE